jgi:osmoprotectant transport system permease protein
MIEYFQSAYPRLFEALFEHMQLVYLSLLIAIVIAAVVVYFFLRSDRWLNRLVYFFSALYSVPSYALFALLIPITGLGKTSAIIVLVLYCEYILLRNFITGIKEIDPVIVESAVAMGMTDQQLFSRIQLPLAAPSIFSGIRLALTSVTGIATIASTINAGGLGTIIFDGLRTQSLVKMIWGTLLTVLLIIVSNFILKWIERYTMRNFEFE